jgi:hypothetical protein
VRKCAVSVSLKRIVEMLALKERIAVAIPESSGYRAERAGVGRTPGGSAALA